MSTRRPLAGRAPLDELSRFKDASQQKALGWELGELCALCAADFTVLRLRFRHHCRFCLKSVCSSCCADEQRDGHRICKGCAGGKFSNGGAAAERAEAAEAEAEQRVRKRARLRREGEERRLAVLGRRRSHRPDRA